MNHLSAFLASFDKYDVYVIVFTLLATGLIYYTARATTTTLNWDHFWQNFDKILAVSLFAGTLILLMHMIHHKVDDASKQWMENLVGQIWSSIAILLGVAKALGRSSDKNGNGNGNTNGQAQPPASLSPSSPSNPTQTQSTTTPPPTGG